MKSFRIHDPSGATQIRFGGQLKFSHDENRSNASYNKLRNRLGRRPGVNLTGSGQSPAIEPL
jgi:hypothetical protein